MLPKRTVHFDPSTKPPTDPTHIHLIPSTEIYLRETQTWIPVQIYDLILLHLYADTNQAPYPNLLATLTALAPGIPLTSHIITEIHRMQHDLPPLLPPSTTIATRTQRQQLTLRKSFDAMNAQFTALQRQRAQQQSEEIAQLAKTAQGSGLPGTIKDASLRAELNMEALRQAQGRARKLRQEVGGVEKVERGGDGDGDGDGGQSKRRRLPTPPDSPEPEPEPEPPRKKRRLHDW